MRGAPVLCNINLLFISISSGFYFNSLTCDLLYHPWQMKKTLLITSFIIKLIFSIYGGCKCPILQVLRKFFWSLKCIALMREGTQSSAFLTFLEKVGECSFLKETSGHAETFTFETLCSSSMSLVPCTHTFEAVFSTAQAKSYKEGQICSNWMILGVFPHLSTQNLLFVLVCVNELFREKRVFSFTHSSCKVFLVNFRLKSYEI